MSKRWQSPSLKGALFGLAAAAMFGASVPLAKQLLAHVHPLVLAGLFYLGSGSGLSCLLVLSRLHGNPALAQAQLKRNEWPWLFSAILSGGVVAGLLLMTGLTRTPASEASLLLNMEGVFTALIAWLIFREPANKTVVAGLVLLTTGAAVLSVGNDWHLHLTLPALCVLGASLGWAADNNLTRKIAHTDPLLIAALKGLTAGSVNMTVGLLMGAHLPAVQTALASAAIGFVCYGLGLVMSILSMRHIGAARSSAYFCTAPFVGAGLSILLCHDPVTPALLVAAAFMAVGIGLYLSEHHEHEHTHEPVTHEHPHIHDEHHMHAHTPEDPPGEPHCHEHTHEKLTHSHAHQPDIHHSHEH